MKVGCIGVGNFGKNVIHRTIDEYLIDTNFITIMNNAKMLVITSTKTSLVFTPNNVLAFRQELLDFVFGKDIILVFSKDSDSTILEFIHDVAYQSRCFVIAMVDGNTKEILEDSFRYCECLYAYLPNKDISQENSFIRGMFYNSTDAFAFMAATLSPLLQAQNDGNSPLDVFLLEELFDTSVLAGFIFAQIHLGNKDESDIKRATLPIVDKINHIGLSNIAGILAIMKSDQEIDDILSDQLLAHISELDLNCPIHAFNEVTGIHSEYEVILEVILVLNFNH